MKRILRLLLIVGPCLFLFVKDVKAVEYSASVTYNQPFDTHIDLSTTRYESVSTGNIYTPNPSWFEFTSNNIVDTRINAISFPDYTFKYKNGVFLPQCGMTFTKGSIYSITYYFVTRADYNLHFLYSGTDKIMIGKGYSGQHLISPRYISNQGATIKINSNDVSGLGYYLSYTTVLFEPDDDGTCLSVPFSIPEWYSESVSGRSISFIGYSYDYIGNSLSDSDIQAALDNQTVQINENIDSMKEKQDKTNELIESEDEDTTSKKCGMLCKLKGIFTGIIELPSKLVNLLVNALKSLFVPTDDQLYEIVNESKELTENFGFVGEAVNFFLTIFTSLLGLVNANGCIELPEFSIGATSLFEAHTFWQAQNVCLGDNAILSANISTIRTITSIALVSLFINFASRKFFSILSKNDNDQARNDAYDIK